MGFFKKDDIQEKEVQVTNETKIENLEIDKRISKKKNLSLFDVDTIQYVIKNFPSMSIEIQSGLSNLASILENTIDHIEDKSNEIIKKDRDFKLSKAYRDTSIAIYSVVENINEYVKWMQDEYEKNIQSDKESICKIRKDLVEIKKEASIDKEKQELKNTLINEEAIEIYKDFSLKEPKAIKLDDNIIDVEDWDDLLVKTAEVLTKQYKKNKNINKTMKSIKPVEKKSPQNSFRDTVIDMLTEYKINFDEFKVIVK
ncbi:MULTISPECIES: hypothetical protein [Clostridium]|uniref:tRNA-dihydrouridine synthase n=1 Tax=Clostridium beijerinckii TaxID=1520 RepID=A0A1B9BS43_CLOBE|nr:MULTISPECIES: hypothetical protein [Clostridium]AQS03386.1 hypothetical protein CLBIJ_07980 [Clostridium beijerinckii]MBA2884639.1 tRNA-dihydrouridine synthase [Clostridium beijerinckii]MBA2899361.1 tRNA-dihydrouridine synthase [Clostridium beijerinckii]MBA2908990.1 tRNA-dihydrouridine synthase [Clostridium beijerinckii]MBA9017075.1 tRNA-dihydrouridine synthase [Clostridium beijerinckii]